MERSETGDQSQSGDLSSCIYGFFWLFAALATPLTVLWYSFFPDIGYSELRGSTVWLHETTLDRWMQLRFWELLGFVFCAGMIVAGCLRRWHVGVLALFALACLGVWIRWWYAM